MSNQVRSSYELIAAYADNTTGAIRAQQGRDLITTVFGVQRTDSPGPLNDKEDTAGIGVKCSKGMLWLRLDTQKIYFCTKDTVGAAEWAEANKTVSITGGQALQHSETRLGSDTNLGTAGQWDQLITHTLSGGLNLVLAKAVFLGPVDEAPQVGIALHFPSADTHWAEATMPVPASGERSILTLNTWTIVNSNLDSEAYLSCASTSSGTEVLKDQASDLDPIPGTDAAGTSVISVWVG